MDHLAERSFWLELDPYTPQPPLEGDLRVDVALVGGGFTSLWTAYLLQQERPELRVAVLEATAVGYGASGRNGGFAMTLVHRTLAHLAAAVGDEGARRIHHAAKAAVEHLTRTVAAEGIACDAEATGLLTVSDAPAQDPLLERELETARRLGVDGDFTWLDRDAARARLHSERIRCGFFESTCTLLNPARLARGLARVLRERGVAIYEGTPVDTVAETTEGVELHTTGGVVRADRALLAGNAWSTAWPETRETVLPMYSYICLTRPLSDAEWERVGWRGREGVEDRRVSLHYFRPTADGRILWGGRDPAFHPDGPKPAYDRDERVFGRMRESFEWFFPALRDVPFTHRWGGPIAVTGTFLPGVGWLSERRRVAFAYGYNGHGVAITNLAAHAVVDLLAERKSEWTELAFVGRRPPHLGPRWLRDPLVRLTLRSQIKADDDGRTAGEPLVLRLLNRLTGAELHNG